MQELNEIIELTLRRDIDTIITNIFSVLEKKDVISIYLYGGYGRGEGSWVIQNTISSFPKISPYNDYDIALVVHKKVSKKSLKQIEINLKNHLDIRWIDLCQYTIYNLIRFKPTIKNYDFKYASKWIYGKKNTLDYIPNIDYRDIGLKDVETLYITRIWTLLGSFPKNGFNSLTRDEEMFFRNQMAKSVLAIVDSILVFEKEYDWSYKKRVSKIKYHTNNQNLISLANWALQEKLWPKSEGLNEKQFISMYKQVHELFFIHMFKYLSIYYKSPINKPLDVNLFVLNDFKRNLKKWIKKYFLHDNSIHLQNILLILQGEIVYYYFGMDDDKLDYIKSLMKSYFNFESNDLDEIRIKVADLRTII